MRKLPGAQGRSQRRGVLQNPLHTRGPQVSPPAQGQGTQPAPSNWFPGNICLGGPKTGLSHLGIGDPPPFQAEPYQGPRVPPQEGPGGSSGTQARRKGQGTDQTSGNGCRKVWKGNPGLRETHWEPLLHPSGWKTLARQGRLVPQPLPLAPPPSLGLGEGWGRLRGGPVGGFPLGPQVRPLPTLPCRQAQGALRPWGAKRGP